MTYNKIVIGVDQSYTKTGISVCCDGKLKYVKSVKFDKCKNKAEKRLLLKKILIKILKSANIKSNNVFIYCERIRLFSQGFINQNYIMSTGALIGALVDTAYNYHIEVYSVDTRSWKSQVVGSSKSKTEDKKKETVDFVESLGFCLTKKNKKGKIIYDDDAADSACIALYGFIDKEKQKLKLEN